MNLVLAHTGNIDTDMEALGKQVLASGDLALMGSANRVACD